MIARLQSLFRTVVRQPGYVFLTGDDAALSSRPAQEFRLAWVGVMAVSLAWGLVSIGLWSACQTLFGRTSEIPSLIPALVIVSVFSLGLYRRGLIFLSQRLSPEEVSVRALVLVLGVLGVLGCFLSIRGYDALQDFWLPAWAQWVRPFEKHQRVLLTAPLWGAWAMMIVPHLCRKCEVSQPATAAFIAGCGPLVSALLMALPLGLSLFYFHFLGWWELLIPCVTVAGAIGGAALLCRLSGGLSRGVLLAVNVLTQGMFLLGYLAARNAG